ncbi:MAG: sulfotransferase [Rhizomicrobium sp.]|jgi:tetratricopeptide (TPR) repeat protein
MTTPSGSSPSPAVGRLLVSVKQLIDAGRFAEAIAPMSEVAEMQPGNALVQTDLGRLYLEAGQPGGALDPLRRALELEPRNGIAQYRLGVALQALNDTDGAIDAFERAVALLPSHSDAHYRLGLMYESLARMGEALASYRTAALTSEDKVARKFIQARVYCLDGREGEAEGLLRRVVELRPDMAMAQTLLGEILAASGRFDEAAACYETAIAASPSSGIGYYNLVRCRKITASDDRLLQRMDAALQLEGMNDYNLSNLQLARGKAFDDLGQYDKAMEAWDAAYAARSRMVPFSADIFDKLIDSLIGMYSVEKLAEFAPLGSEDRTPVLIVGMPRSGTTLCEQIISSHPRAVGVGELGFWDQRSQIAFELGEPASERDFIADCASAFLEMLRTLPRVSASFERVADKNPFNYLSIGLIHLAFPHAPIIHCRRSPVDTALSIHQIHFATWTAMPTGGEDLVRYYRAYERLMAHWRSVLPPGRMLEVDYETLTASPEQEIRRIVGYVGLDWDDACLRPQDNTRIVRTPSRWQVRQPINTSSVGRWRRYEPWLGPLASLIGNGASRPNAASASD